MSETKVFVLMEWVEHEGSYLQGVYSTAEAADAALAGPLSKFVNRAGLKVHEVTLDALPEYVT